MIRGPHFARGCKRRTLRYRPGHAEEAVVEFALPDGSRWRLSLVEIGGGGICFGLEDGRPPITVGMEIAGAGVQVGDVRLLGSLRVVHVNAEFGAGTVCGAEFVPASESDARELASLLDGLDSRGRGID